MEKRRLGRTGLKVSVLGYGAGAVGGLFSKGRPDDQERLEDVDFRPGSESLDVRLFDERDIPWEALAFRTIARTLRNWFLDRKSGVFPLRLSELSRRPPVPLDLLGAA